MDCELVHESQGPEKYTVQMHRRVRYECVCVCSYIVQTKLLLLKEKIHHNDDNFSGKEMLESMLALSNTKMYSHVHKIKHTQRIITCSAATNWIVLTIARDCPEAKLSLTVSRKCALSIWISTNTYSILIPAVESMGTAERQTQKNDRWIIHSVMSAMPVVYTLLMAPETSTHSTCSGLQQYGTHSTCSSRPSDMKVIECEFPAHAGTDAKTSIM